MGKPSDVDGIYGGHLFGVAGTTTNRNPVAEYEGRIERMLVYKLIELCVNRFKWIGLPDEIDKRFLELNMFYQGLTLFYWSDDYNKYFALRGSGMGVDIYNNPLTYNVINRGASLIPRIIGKNQCVPIWANYMRTSELETVLIYARRLARMDRTIEINTDNARQPRILTAGQNSQLSVENLSTQIDQGVPVIKIRDTMDPTAVANALDMGVDADLFDKLGISRTRTWNECMSMLGIKNANQEKKERLVEDEVSANDEQIDFIRAVNLNARQMAAEAINKKFNLSVSVDYDQDISRNEAF